MGGGGGEEGTVHHFSSLSRSGSSVICQKTKSSALLISALAATSTRNPRRQLSPAQLPYPNIPWHRITLGIEGWGHRPPPLPYICHMLLAQSIMGCTVADSSYAFFLPCCWDGIRLVLTPSSPPCPPLLSPSQTFAMVFHMVWPPTKYVQRLGLVLGLENQPLSVPVACCKLTLNLWQLWRWGK